MDYVSLRKHLKCRWGGMYLTELADGGFEVRCQSRFHGGSDLLVFAIPAPPNNAVHLTPAAAGSRDDNDTEPQAQVTADR